MNTHSTLCFITLLAALLLGCTGEKGTTTPEDTNTETDTNTADTSSNEDTHSEDATRSDATSTTDASNAEDTETAETDTTEDADVGEVGCDPEATPFGSEIELDANGQTHTFQSVCSRTHLENIALNPTGKFAIVSDIDLAGAPWTPIPEFQGWLVSDGSFAIQNLLLESDGTATNQAFISWLTNGAVLSGLRFTSPTYATGNGAIVASIVQGALLEDLGKAVEPFVIVDDITIEGATMSLRSTTTGGVFRVLQDGSQVSNIAFQGAVSVDAQTFSGSAVFFGGISWRLVGNATLSNAIFRGNISLESYDKFGGVIAETNNTASLENCVVDAQLVGGGEVGGIIGHHAGGSIRNCRVLGTFRSSSTRSGAVTSGSSSGGTASHVYVSAQVEDAADAISGFYEWDGGSHMIYNSDFAQNGSTATGATGLDAGAMANPDDPAWDDFPSPPWSFVPGSLPVLDFE